MSRTTETKAAPRRGRVAKNDDALDEACFLAELRLSVEGARTLAEERLVRRYPGLQDRFGTVCAKFAN